MKGNVMRTLGKLCRRSQSCTSLAASWVILSFDGRRCAALAAAAVAAIAVAAAAISRGGRCTKRHLAGRERWAVPECGQIRLVRMDNCTRGSLS